MSVAEASPTGPFSEPWPTERLWLYLNFTCNLSCAYCLAGSGPHSSRPGLSVHVVRKLVDEAVALGFRQLVFTDEEPFLRADLVPLLGHASAHADTIVLTNGMLLTPAVAGGLAECRVSGSRSISLDAATPGRLNAQWQERFGLRCFRVRGLDKVLSVALLMAVAHNLLRWMALGV